jgi:hypothetical protein
MNPSPHPSATAGTDPLDVIVFLHIVVFLLIVILLILVIFLL